MTTYAYPSLLPTAPRDTSLNTCHGRNSRAKLGFLGGARSTKTLQNSTNDTEHKHTTKIKTHTEHKTQLKIKTHTKKEGKVQTASVFSEITNVIKTQPTHICFPCGHRLAVVLNILHSQSRSTKRNEK